MLDLQFQLKPSRYYCYAFICFWVAALMIALLVPNGWEKWILFVATGLYGAYIFRKYVLLRDDNSITGLRRLSDGRWLLKTLGDQEYSADIMGESTITHWISVLLFRGSHCHASESWHPVFLKIFFWMPAFAGMTSFTKTCVVWQDSFANPDDYRRLVVAMKTQF